MNACPTCRTQHEHTGACQRCEQHALGNLTAIERFIALLKGSPELRAQHLTSQEGRSSGNNALIINVQIADLIAPHGVEAMLLAWTEFINDERNTNWAPAQGRPKLQQIITYLIANLPWLAEHEDAWPDFYNETRSPAAQLRRIVLGERRPPQPVPCPVQDCEGRLRLAANGDATCSYDESHYWAYEDWSRLALLVATA